MSRFSVCWVQRGVCINPLLRQQRRHCLRCQLRDCQAALFYICAGLAVGLFVNGDRDCARVGQCQVLPNVRIPRTFRGCVQFGCR